MRALILVALAACGTKSEPAPAAGSAPPPPPPPSPDAAVEEPRQIPCAVTIRLDADGAAIASAAGGCRAPRNAGALDVAWIEGELRSLRAAFGTCPVNATVASSSGSYQELLSIMDRATLLGFSDAGVAAPGELRFANIDSHAAHCKLPLAGAPNTSPPPPPAAKGPTQQAPLVAITKTAVSYGKLTVALDALAKGDAALAPIVEALRKDDEVVKIKYADKKLPPDLAKSCDDALQGIRPAPGHICPVGLAILQADPATDVKVVNAVLLALHGVGYDNLLYAVK